MKKTAMAALIVMLVILGLLFGCQIAIIGEKGSGDLETRDMDFSGFTRIDAGYAFEVEIVQSDSFSVSVTADDNLFDYVQVSKRGDTLVFDVRSGPHRFTALEAEITMPDLYEVELSGASQGTVRGFSSSHDFIAVVSGASRVSGDITAGDAEFEASGASTIDLRGSADDILVDASGASTVELGDFPVNDADVTLSAASRATVNLDGRLDADLSGASNLRYIGEPTMGDVETSGASTLGRK